MSKKDKSKKIKTFDSFEEDELLDATEQFNNDNAKSEFDFNDLSSDSQSTDASSSINTNSRIRAIKNFANSASDTLSSVSYDPYDDSEGEDKSGERYQSDLSNLSSGISDGVKRVNDIIDTMKKNDLSKSRDEREAIKKGFNNSNVRNNNASSSLSSERHNIVDKKTLSEAATDKERAEKNKTILDEAFELPEKKKSLSDRLLNFKDKEIAKAKAKKDAVKNKGLLNSLVEKIGGASSKGVMGLLLKWTLIVILIIFIFTLFIAVIFYFSNNYTRDPNNNLDSRRLDTRALRAIYTLKETDALNEYYAELINTSSGATRSRYQKNLQRLVPSNDLEKLRAGEDPDEAYILQDSSNWYLLYLERLSYAYGGYLDWEPEYLDYGAFADTTMRNASGASVERWREIATKAGEENGIDPNILLAIVDIESGGNPHAKNGSHWGLGQIGEGIFKSYFTPKDRFYNWTDDMRCPADTGSCDLDDKNHKDNAEMQFTYIARRLSHQMGLFLVKNKGVSLSNASMQDKQTAIAFAVCGYNQGEDRILALYKEYGDQVLSEDGSNYANKFLAHVDTPLKYKGYKMIGANQANYLKLFYKFYNYYSGNTTITNAQTDVTSWYQVGDLEANKNKKSSGKYPGPVTEQVKLSYGSTETDAVNEIKTIYYEGLIRDIVKQYNNEMSAFNNYYLANYPDKFIVDRLGNLIPELYAKDEYGMDIKSNVIKHQSYIHTVVDNVTNYNTKKTYNSGSKQGDYSLLKKDLDDELNDVTTRNSYEQYKEPLSDLEDDLAINRYEMSFEVIRTVDSNNEMLSNDEAIDTIEKSLSYSVPIYEYVTTNENKAYKSFFDYEIYNANNYNDDYTLKINDSKFRNHIKGINNINISMKSFVKNGYSLSGEQSVANRMNEAFNFMYLNNDKAYNSSNHYAEVPRNLSNYYYISRDEIYDRMVEKTKAVEIYEQAGASMSAGENQTIEWTTVTSDNGVSYDYKGLETTVVRDYYLSNLKPSTYTALKYIATFDYVSQETGDREVDKRDPEVVIKKGTIYETTKDEDGNKVKTKVGEVYKKTITRNNVYEKEKLRNETIKTRGLN